MTNWSTLVPELVVFDFDASLRFYRDIIGFTVRYRREAPRFAYLELDAAELMLHEYHRSPIYGDLERGQVGRGFHLQIEVDSIGPLLARCAAYGVELRRPPSDAWYRGDGVEYGNREFFVADPDGFLLRFFEDLGERPVTEP